ncbi:MAG: hypothetical protein K2X01_02385 [Cyanobacteria bacterium]|nr:hypothetical protein [Cyanobacteriota bacterium]
MTRSERLADPLTGEIHDYDQSTFLFRDPVGTFGLPKVLKDCFRSGADIQVYGGSDGSDAYSLLMVMNQVLGADAVSQRYPIHSIDLSSERTRIAESGIFGLVSGKFGIETAKWAKYIKPEWLNIFDSIDNPSGDILDAGINDQLDRPCEHPEISHMTHRQLAQMAYKWFQIKPGPKSQVHFSVGDIRERAKMPFTKPSILFCRHFLYQLKPQDRTEVIQNLSKNLPKGSMVVLGDDEKGTVQAKELFDNGFKTIVQPKELTGVYWVKT